MAALVTPLSAKAARKAAFTLDLDIGDVASGCNTPPWVRDGGTEKLLKRLRDPEIRRKIQEEMNQVGQGWENMAYSNGWKNVIATVVQTEKNKNHEGKNFSEIRELRNDPDEITSLCDLLLEEEGIARIVIFGQDENEMRQVMQHPLQMVGSDGRSVATYGVLHVGKPHPRFYGPFPRVLRKYVREEGILKLEDAIRRILRWVAQLHLGEVRMHIHGQGGPQSVGQSHGPSSVSHTPLPQPDIRVPQPTRSQFGEQRADQRHAFLTTVPQTQQSPCSDESRPSPI